MALKNYIKEHKRDIAIIAGTSIVVGGAAYLIYKYNIKQQQEVIDFLATEVASLDETLCNMWSYHEALCEAKDTAYLALASDALRHGSSQGGQVLADWKACQCVAA